MNKEPITSSHLRLDRPKIIYGLSSIFITVALLTYALHDASITNIFDSFRTIQIRWLLIGWFAYMAMYTVRVFRWGTLLAVSGNSGRWKTRFYSTIIGFGASCILPGHAGEFIRPIILYRIDRVPVESSFSSIFVERLMDILVVILLLFIPLASGTLPPTINIFSFGIPFMGLLVILGWTVLLVLSNFPDASVLVVGKLCNSLRLSKYQETLSNRTYQFIKGLTALGNLRCIFTVFAQTIIIWLLNGLTFWFGMIAVGISSPGYTGALFTQSITALAIALPSTPGYIGPFEAGVRGTLVLFNVPVDTSIACALSLRLIMYVSIPVLAGILLMILGYSRILLRNNSPH